MAIAGGALPGRTGIILYSAQTDQGTPVTPATAAGLASWDVTNDAGMQAFHAVGQSTALFLKPGNSVVTGTISIAALQTSALLLRAQRSSGVLPWNTFLFAYEDDASTDYGWQVQDAKIGSYDISLDAGGPLTGSFSFTGGLITELSSSLEPANLTPTPMWAYEAVLTKGGSAHESVGFRLNVNHNLEPQYTIPGAAPSTFKRGFSYLTEGQMNISGEITRFAKSGIDLQAGTISDFALVLTCTDVAGGMTPNAISFTFAGVKFGSERWAAGPEGTHQYTTPFLAKTLTVA